MFDFLGSVRTYRGCGMEPRGLRGSYAIVEDFNDKHYLNVKMATTSRSTTC